VANLLPKSHLAEKIWLSPVSGGVKTGALTGINDFRIFSKF